MTGRGPLGRRRGRAGADDAGTSRGPREELGLLQPIVDAEVAAGHDVRVTAPGALAHGDRPEARLLAARGRGEVETAWDLGPLLGWVPEARGWRLEDATSGARLSLARTPEDDRPLPVRADRPRLGHLDQHPTFVAWLASATSPADELDRLAAPTWDEQAVAAAPWREATKQRVVTDAPAAVVLERLHEMLASVASSGASADDLPGWFAAACPPPWPTDEHLRAWRGLDELRGREARRAQWQLRWTAAETARQLDPRHRLWRVRMLRVTDEHTLDVLVDRAPVSHLAPAEWLLQVCGAARCEPLPPPR